MFFPASLTLRGFGTDVIDVVEARIIVLIDSSAGKYSEVSFSWERKTDTTVNQLMYNNTGN